jgi:hypothetical protein
MNYLNPLKDPSGIPDKWNVEEATRVRFTGKLGGMTINKDFAVPCRVFGNSARFIYNIFHNASELQEYLDNAPTYYCNERNPRQTMDADNWKNPNNAAVKALDGSVFFVSHDIRFLSSNYRNQSCYSSISAKAVPYLPDTFIVDMDEVEDGIIKERSSGRLIKRYDKMTDAEKYYYIMNYANSWEYDRLLPDKFNESWVDKSSTDSKINKQAEELKKMASLVAYYKNENHLLKHPKSKVRIDKFGDDTFNDWLSKQNCVDETKLELQEVYDQVAGKSEGPKYWRYGVSNQAIEKFKKYPAVYYADDTFYPIDTDYVDSCQLED